MKETATQYAPILSHTASMDSLAQTVQGPYGTKYSVNSCILGVTSHESRAMVETLHFRHRGPSASQESHSRVDQRFESLVEDHTEMRILLYSSNTLKTIKIEKGPKYGQQLGN